jgi:hypothetical protein
MSEKVKLRAGNYMVPATLTYDKNRIKVAFGYNPALLSEIKNMEGAKWHGFDDPPEKVWSVSNSLRNAFVFEFLKGGDPYAFYDKPLEDVQPIRSLRKHQVLMFQFTWTRRRCVLGAEMGTGKSLVFIEIAERYQREQPDADVWYVGPVAGVKAVKKELIKWQSKLNVRFMTYNELVTTVKNWTAGQKAPAVVCYDESSKIKTHTSQRTQAAMHVANAVAKEHNGIVMCMSGTPAPKNPCDWWSQAETCCPGFIKEGHPNKLAARLSLTEQREGCGGAYPHRITWLDDAKKCAVCGQFQNDAKHLEPKTNRNVAFDPKVVFGTVAEGESKSTEVKATETYYHKYVPSINEVAKMYNRLKGLVLIVMKKDCLDLPEKDYRIVEVKPTTDMIRASALIKKQSPRVITALTLLRELSDGFQYQDVAVDEKTCPICRGTEVVLAAADESGVSNAQAETIACTACHGSGYVPVMERQVIEGASPKDEALIEILEEHEDTGRAVIWGGFEGTVNRLVKLVNKQGWAVLKIDGKGWVGTDHNGNRLNTDELLDAMDGSSPKRQALLEKYPMLAVVANPDAGGMALTFTASSFCVYYSNSFSGEARIQSEDRIHRLGMDQNRGCIIYDLICMPSDKLVYNNLMQKKRLQALTMGEIIDS